MAWGGETDIQIRSFRNYRWVLTTRLEHACVRAHTHTHPHTHLRSADLWLELNWFRHGVCNAEKAGLDAGSFFCSGL